MMKTYTASQIYDAMAGAVTAAHNTLDDAKAAHERGDADISFVHMATAHAQGVINATRAIQAILALPRTNPPRPS